MEKTHILRLLERIQMLLDENTPISPMEKDIILDYLRQVYDAVCQLPVNQIKTTDGITHPPIREVQSESNAKPRHESSYIAFGQHERQHVSPAETEVDFRRPDTREFRIQDETSADHPTSKEQDPALHELFEFGSARELSEKISALPIKDLNQAFSINDRLLAINELFGGDSHYFSRTLESINRRSSFEEAKSYLINHVVDKYGWADNHKQKSVKAFLKLVRRRFQH